MVHPEPYNNPPRPNIEKLINAWLINSLIPRQPIRPAPVYLKSLFIYVGPRAIALHQIYLPLAVRAGPADRTAHSNIARPLHTKD